MPGSRCSRTVFRFIRIGSLRPRRGRAGRKVQTNYRSCCKIMEIRSSIATCGSCRSRPCRWPMTRWPRNLANRSSRRRFQPPPRVRAATRAGRRPSTHAVAIARQRRAAGFCGRENSRVRNSICVALCVMDGGVTDSRVAQHGTANLLYHERYFERKSANSARSGLACIDAS